jgi:hypothetical protein
LATASLAKFSLILGGQARSADRATLRKYDIHTTSHYVGQQHIFPSAFVTLPFSTSLRKNTASGTRDFAMH